MQNATTSPTQRYTASVMGTVASLHIYTPHTPTVANTASTDVFAELHRLESIFSTFRRDSAISRINRGEIDIADAPREVADVLDACSWLERKSHNVFSAFQSDDGNRLDPAGFVKGWATERAAERLHDHDLHNWYLSVGGDIIMAGAPAPGRLWNTAIVDPDDDANVVMNLTLPPGAVATSGTSQRGAHIRTAADNANGAAFASVTVVGPKLAWADAFATTVFATGNRGLRWIRQFPDYQAIAVLRK